jgi:hypothetical protein
MVCWQVHLRKILKGHHKILGQVEVQMVLDQEISVILRITQPLVHQKIRPNIARSNRLVSNNLNHLKVLYLNMKRNKRRFNKAVTPYYPT